MAYHQCIIQSAELKMIQSYGNRVSEKYGCASPSLKSRVFASFTFQSVH